MTEQERLMWIYLRRRQLDGFKFRRQAPLGPYIADFACLSVRVIIEIDGGQHSEQLQYDWTRTAWLRAQGFEVLRFWNHEVSQHLDAVYQRIEEVLRKNRPPIPTPPPQGGKGSHVVSSPEEDRRVSAPNAPIPTLPPRGGKGLHEASLGDGADGVAGSAPRPDRSTELRVFGVNACQAVAARRPHAIRKAYLTEARVAVFRTVLADLAKRRVGYNIVLAEDLERLTQSTHHEGVCFEVKRAVPVPLRDFLVQHKEPRKPSLVILLDGVENPHNFGAVLRIAAHFGADAVLLPPGGKLTMSGAACRVAEGGAEAVPVIALGDLTRDIDALERAGFVLAATVVRDGSDLYTERLPKKLVLIFGAEGSGMSRALLARCRFKVGIPGSGAVESLNIAAAVAVIAGEYWRQHRNARGV